MRTAQSRKEKTGQRGERDCAYQKQMEMRWDEWSTLKNELVHEKEALVGPVNVALASLANQLLDIILQFHFLPIGTKQNC